MFFSFLFFQTDAGWEEYFDYIFPEDEATKPNLKLLAMAKAWKMAKESAPSNQEEELPKSNAPLADTVLPPVSLSTVPDDRDDSSESSSSESENKDQLLLEQKIHFLKNDLSVIVHISLSVL